MKERKKNHFLPRKQTGGRSKKKVMLSFASGGYYDEPVSPHGGNGGGLDLPVRSFTTEYEDECVSVR